jgi:hypothetical protein
MVSTGLTLFVIPSLYVLMVEKMGMRISSTHEHPDAEPVGPAGEFIR